MRPAAGSCECGAIRYRLTDAPVVVNCCHCRDCQRITGSAFALNGMIETDRIVVVEGEPAERHGDGGRSWRCARCETLLWADHPMFDDSVRFVRLGTLGEGERFAPDAHFFVRSKHPWVTLPPELPAFATLPGPQDRTPLPPDRRARLDAIGARCRPETKPE